MNWVNLVNSGLKSKLIRNLMEEYESIENLYNNLYKLEKNIRKNIENCILKDIEFKDYRVISYFDEEYPEYLRNISYYPVFLYLKGKKLLNDRNISIVGTRKCSTLGKNSCEKIIKELSEYNGISIISGLAKGIDSISLKKAIEYELNPVAVIPTDILSCYPLDNRNLLSEIEKKGTIITEFPLGTRLTKRNFVIRNRIIAGISLSLIIVESYKSGGSMITAKFAQDYFRDIYAIPNNIYAKSFEGCNDLIKKNTAKLIQSASDIAYEYGWRRKIEEESCNS